MTSAELRSAEQQNARRHMTTLAVTTISVADVMVRGPKTHTPESAVEEVRAFFEDEHVHMALIVAPNGHLITTIERSDLAGTRVSSAHVSMLGTLAGRTVRPADALDTVTAAVLREGRRRLAVIDDSGRLLGLLCLNRDGTGYCSDEGIRTRREVGNHCPEVMISHK